MKLIIQIGISFIMLPTLNAQVKSSTSTSTTTTEKTTSVEKQEVSVSTTTINNETVYKYKVQKTNKDGSVEVIEWEGKDRSKMPDELKTIVGDKFEDEPSKGNEKQKVKVKVMKDGKESAYEYESDVSEIEFPEEVLKELNKSGISEEMLVVKKNDQQNPKKYKAQLGVMIQDHAQGVQITNLVDGSSAIKGGLMKGDIITAIDNKPVKTTKDLISVIGSYYAYDEIEVKFIRGTENLSRQFILQKRFPRTWEEVMENGE